MKAAIVPQSGSVPIYGDFREPVPASGECRIAVTAAALSPVVKARASGGHYSAPDAFPFVVGIDGVGRLDDGRRVYFILPKPPFGSMAQWAAVPSAQCVPVPDGLDDIAAAALPNPGLSSWAALTERARFKPGETVLVNGATGTSGRLAVQIAKHLGAGKVVATGRNPAALRKLHALGADETVVLSDDADALDRAFKQCFARGIDVVLDYLWGHSAERLLLAASRTLAEGVPLRFVQLGHASAPTVALPASVLRSAAIELTGSGLGSVPLHRIVRVVDELLRAAITAGFRIETQSLPLSDVERAWVGEKLHPRTVFTISERGR